MVEHERIFEGTAIAPGLAIGGAFIYRNVLQRDLEFYDIAPNQVETELARLDEAVQEVANDLQLSAERIEQELDSDLADVFRAHEQILFDKSLREEIAQNLETELINVEQVVKMVLHRWVRRLREIDNEDLRSRADDISDLSGRLLHSLVGIQTHGLEKMPEGSVLIARRLFPSDTVFLSRRTTRGVVARFGGPGSHAALLARKMDIPTVIGDAKDVDSIKTGTPVLVDGFSGRVVIHPLPKTKAEWTRVAEKRLQVQATARWNRHHRAITKTGVQINVMANVGSRHDTALAVDNGAEGIGLFRIEQIYLTRKVLPNEDELQSAIEEAVEPIGNKPICVRLLDLGGDKDLPFLNLPREHDSFLGVRGVRVLFRYPDLLQTQLNAFLRLAQYRDIRILVPLVTTARDMARIREFLNSCATDVGHRIPPLGAMVETPAVALCTREITSHADFLSIGTNDLTQYTMAAGRENPSADEYFVDDHPAVIRLIQIVVDEAGNRPVSLCGELASNVKNIGTLLDAGLRSISVSPPRIPSIKQAIREHSPKPDDVQSQQAVRRGVSISSA
jgi:phosphotransferase system enzyme I (PtsI)